MRLRIAAARLAATVTLLTTAAVAAAAPTTTLDGPSGRVQAPAARRAAVGHGAISNVRVIAMPGRLTFDTDVGSAPGASTGRRARTMAARPGVDTFGLDDALLHAVAAPDPSMLALLGLGLLALAIALGARTRRHAARAFLRPPTRRRAD